MKAKKPSPSTILAAVPLSNLPARQADALAACNVCGQPSDSLRLWREGNEYDQPIAGPAALVFIGNDHPGCIKTMEAHPRLYVEERGNPGHFPALCGPCTFRRGFGCSHPELKTNGGPGLEVQLTNMGMIIVCSRRGGCHRPLPRAMACAGQKLAGEVSGG